MKQLHDLQQGSDAWHQFRFEHDGASEAAAMLGLSRTVKRNELLRMKKTGIAKSFSDWVQENVLDHGHDVEELARPIVEEIFSVKLYPVTYSNGQISASCDGIDMADELVMEHKQWNEALAARVRTGSVPLEHMPQCQQALMVTEAEELVFVVSDGTREKMVWCIVKPDPEWFERIRAGWAQFHKDLAEYVPTEPVVEAIGRTPETLPALRIEVTGAVTASNLAQYREHALAVFAGINRDLKTDQDFANADKTVKWCGDVEDRLKAAKEHALSQTESIDQLFKTIDDITAEARKTRLELASLVKARKDARKAEIVTGGARALAEHVLALNARIGAAYMPPQFVDFAAATKNLRTFDSMQNAVDTTLANAKIAASAAADRIQTNLAYLSEDVPQGHAFLFADLQALVLKASDDFRAVVDGRIAAHKEKREREEAEQRERIRKEEVARIEREQAEKDRKAEADAKEAQRLAEAAKQPVVDAPIAAPAPVAAAAAPAVISMPPRTTTVPITAPALSLGQISTRLGFTVTADFLRTIGFEPSGRQRATVLYHEYQFSHICAALVEHIQSIQALQAA